MPIKVIIITAGTQITLPSDWNSANNSIECIGWWFGRDGRRVLQKSFPENVWVSVAVRMSAYRYEVGEQYFHSTHQ